MNAHRQQSPVITVSRKHDGAIAELGLAIDPEKHIPEKSFYADYCEVELRPDGAKILLGKVAASSPPEEPALDYALEVSIPRVMFFNQLYKSLLTPSEPGKPLFTDSVRKSAELNGYPIIHSFKRASRPAPGQIAYRRANASMMFIFEDDTCVDFLYADAVALPLATKGKRSNNVVDQVRVMMAPNVLLHLTELIAKAAKELVASTPSIDRGER
jgi:hypothetical protein